MRVSIIAAYGLNREIGYQNKLLWHISNDLKRFKRITSGHTIIMGRLTFDSIGCKALPNRRNIVLSKQSEFSEAQVEIANSLEQALEMIAGEKEVFIIGGTSVYEQFLPFSDKMYLTRVHNSFQADSFFPSFIEDEWKEIDKMVISNDLQAGVDYSFVTLSRIK